MAKKKQGDIGTMKQLKPVPRKFMEADKEGSGNGLFYFHDPDDFLFGYLIGKQSRETFHYRVTTYSMKAIEARQDGCDVIIEEDQVIEFPANIKLRRLLEDHELIGSLVKIIFKGRRGRYKKYEVYQDEGTFYSNQEQKYERTRRKRKSERKGATANARAGRTATA